MQNLNFIFGTEEEYQDGLNQYRIEANLQTNEEKSQILCKTRGNKYELKDINHIWPGLNRNFTTDNIRYHGGLHKWQPRNNQQF